jgi:hypothetical protein
MVKRRHDPDYIGRAASGITVTLLSPAASVARSTLPQELADERPEFHDQLLKVFGPLGSAVRVDNNLFSIFQSASPKDLPYFYLACGSADDFLNQIRARRKTQASLSLMVCEDG